MAKEVSKLKEEAEIVKKKIMRLVIQVFEIFIFYVLFLLHNLFYVSFTVTVL